MTVTARHPVLGSVAEIQTDLKIYSSVPSHPFCSVHLINRGWRLEREGKDLVVEFAGTGLSSQSCARFECALDQRRLECKSYNSLAILK